MSISVVVVETFSLFWIILFLMLWLLLLLIHIVLIILIVTIIIRNITISIFITMSKLVRSKMEQAHK